jgi:acylphosphatase
MVAALKDPPLETVSVRVTGGVQGVGYRAATVRHAHLLGVRGWVQNAPDGAVEAMLQGHPDQIDRMLQWMGKGPPTARVKEITHQPEAIERRFKRFEQL